MAKECLELHLYGIEENKEEIPNPSHIIEIKHTKNQAILLVKANMRATRDEMNNKAVKKTLTIPKWLNDEAINNRISFTRFLYISAESEVPDHSTISRFRNSLIDNNLDKQLFLEINQQLVKKGILVKNGAIVDATIVRSSRRP